MRRRRVVGWCCLVLVVSGCGGPAGHPEGTGSGRTGSQGPVRSAPVDVTTLPVSLDRARASRDGDAWSLLESFTTGGMSRREQEVAIQERAAACMRAAGWRYEPSVGVYDGDLVTVGQLRAYRTAHGYGLFTEAGRPKADPNQVYEAGLSPDRRRSYLEALWGSSRGRPETEGDRLPGPDERGCRPVAERAVRAGIPRYDSAVNAYLMANPASSHPLMDARVAEWARCMHDGGVRVDSLADLEKTIGELSREASDDDARRREIALATVDVRCYLKILHPAQRVVEAEVLRALARRFPSYADQVERTLDTSSGSARKRVGDG